jgi:hypothetical protein
MFVRLWCLLLVAVIPSYWFALHTPAVGIYHDDSVYLTTARALAQGRGYVIESLPNPIPQTKYPILFPASLALVWKLFPDFPSNTLALKLLPFSWALAWFAVAAVLLQKLAPGIPWAVLALVAASPMVVFLSTAVLSETMFATLATLALYYFTRWEKSNAWRDLILAGLFSSAAYHTRTIGLALVLTGLLLTARRRSWPQVFGFGLLCGTLVFPWLVWQYAHQNAENAYLSSTNYYTGYNVIMNFAWPEKWQIVWQNALVIPFSTGLLYNLAAAGAVGFLFLPLLLRGWWKSLQRASGQESIALFLAISGLLIMLWAWMPLRFLVPMMPLAALLVWQGCPLRGRFAVAALALALTGHGVWTNYRASSASQKSGIWLYKNADHESWRAFRQQVDWIGANTKPGDVIQSNIDPTVFLYTGRAAIRGPEGNAVLAYYLQTPEPLGTVDNFRATLQKHRVRYVVETPWDWFSETPHLARLISDLRRAQPQTLELVHTASDPGYRIYRVNAGLSR